MTWALVSSLVAERNRNPTGVWRLALSSLSRNNRRATIITRAVPPATDSEQGKEEEEAWQGTPNRL